MFDIVNCMQYVNMGCVHLGEHKHHVAQGECKETVDILKKMVQKEVHRSPRAKAFAIALVVEKT